MSPFNLLISLTPHEMFCWWIAGPIIAYMPFANSNMALQWRHDERGGVSNHQPCDCFLNRFFQAQIKENTKDPRYWSLWRNSPVTGEFPAHRASNAENNFIWWRHHELFGLLAFSKQDEELFIDIYIIVPLHDIVLISKTVSRTWHKFLSSNLAND